MYRAGKFLNGEQLKELFLDCEPGMQTVSLGTVTADEDIPPEAEIYDLEGRKLGHVWRADLCALLFEAAARGAGEAGNPNVRVAKKAVEDMNVMAAQLGQETVCIPGALTVVK